MGSCWHPGSLLGTCQAVSMDDLAVNLWRGAPSGAKPLPTPQKTKKLIKTNEPETGAGERVVEAYESLFLHKNRRFSWDFWYKS